MVERPSEPGGNWILLAARRHVTPREYQPQVPYNFDGDEAANFNRFNHFARLAISKFGCLAFSLFPERKRMIAVKLPSSQA